MACGLCCSAADGAVASRAIIVVIVVMAIVVETAVVGTIVVARGYVDVHIICIAPCSVAVDCDRRPASVPACVEMNVSAIVATSVVDEDRRTSLEEMVSVAVDAVDAEAPYAIPPGDRGEEILEASKLLVLPGGEHVLQVSVATVPPYATDIGTGVDHEQVVEAIIIARIIIFFIVLSSYYFFRVILIFYCSHLYDATEGRRLAVFSLNRGSVFPIVAGEVPLMGGGRDEMPPEGPFFRSFSCKVA